MPTTISSFTVFGAIEQRWLSLGGVGGFLGAPISNESPTFDGKGRAQSFKGGVVSWHPSTGAQEVHGAILVKWLELGREQFGYPTTNESSCIDGIGRYNHFKALQFPGSAARSIFWSPTLGAHEVKVFGAIEQRWLSLGGFDGLLGAPTSNESTTFDGKGRAQAFDGGVVSWHPSTGAQEVHGAILDRWLKIGREQFGYPTTNESPCPDHIGRFNHFKALQWPGAPDCSVYWSPASGAHEVYGAIRGKWASLGWETGVLHYPIEAEHDQAGGGRTQRFQGGVITWTPAGGAAEHEVFGDTAVFDTGWVTSDLPLGGFAHLVVNRSGNFTFSSHAHDSGFNNIDYGISAVLMTATGQAFTLQHAGGVEGTIAGLPFGTPRRDDNFSQSGNNPFISGAWNEIVASGRLTAGLTGADQEVGALTDLIKQAAQAAAVAGATAVIALL